jgi:hypothetical protein
MDGVALSISKFLVARLITKDNRSMFSGLSMALCSDRFEGGVHTLEGRLCELTHQR